MSKSQAIRQLVPQLFRSRCLTAMMISWAIHGLVVDMANAEDAANFVDVSDSASVEFTPDKNERVVPERFRLKAHRFDADAELLRESGSLRVHTVTFPSPVETAIEENNTVHAEYFQPSGKGPFPGVVVLHILGGEFPLSQTVASSLARARVAALFVKMPYYGERRSRQPRRVVEGRNPRMWVAWKE
jgi:hypothetical protein